MNNEMIFEGSIFNIDVETYVKHCDWFKSIDLREVYEKLDCEFLMEKLRGRDITGAKKTLVQRLNLINRFSSVEKKTVNEIYGV